MNQILYLSARTAGFFALLVIMGVFEQKYLPVFFIGLTVLVLDLIVLLKKKWNSMGLVIASLCSIPFLLFQGGEPVIAITMAMIITIFISPFVSGLLFTIAKQEEKIA